MTATLLVSLDGSDKDARALPVALALADLARADVHLVHVLPTDLPAPGAEKRAGERRDAEARVAAAAARAGADAARGVTWEVIDGAGVAEELVRLAAARDALALVMATRAATALGRAVIGSVADHVVRECPRPVMLVPPQAAYVEGHRVRFRRALVPLDGSPLAERALDLLLQLPGVGALEIGLLEVVPPGADRRAIESRLAATAAHARARAAAVEVAVPEGTDAAVAIVASLREALIDLVAMSTRGRGGLRRLVLGSVAEAVIRASEVPVLLLSPASLDRT